MLRVSSILVLVAICIVAADEMSWEDFKLKYKKSYATPEEEERHRQNFLAVLKIIEDHNQKRAKGEVSYSIGVNQFSDQDRALSSSTNSTTTATGATDISTSAQITAAASTVSESTNTT